MLFHLSRRKHYHSHSFLHLLSRRGNHFASFFIRLKNVKKGEKKFFFPQKKRFKKVSSVLDPISDNCCSADTLLKIKFQPSVNFNDCFPIQFSQMKLRRFELISWPNNFSS
jgi:hypothetical protein